MNPLTNTNSNGSIPCPGRLLSINNKNTTTNNNNNYNNNNNNYKRLLLLFSIILPTLGIIITINYLRILHIQTSVLLYYTTRRRTATSSSSSSFSSSSLPVGTLLVSSQIRTNTTLRRDDNLAEDSIIDNQILNRSSFKNDNNNNLFGIQLKLDHRDYQQQQQQQEQQQQQFTPVGTTTTTSTITTKNIRTAICIRGDDRGVPNAYNIYKTIIEPSQSNNVDLYFVVHTTNYSSMTTAKKGRKNNNNNNKNNNNNTSTSKNSSRKIIMEPFLLRQMKQLQRKQQQSQNNSTSSTTSFFTIIGSNTKQYTVDELRTKMIQEGMNLTYWERIYRSNRKLLFYSATRTYNDTTEPQQQQQQRYYNKYHHRHNNALGPILTRGSTIYQLHDFITCHNMIMKQERRMEQPYDYVMILRSDVWCLGQPFCYSNLVKQRQQQQQQQRRTPTSSSSSTTTTTIYVPQGEDYDGINDRMILLPRNAAMIFLSQPYYNLINNINPSWFSFNTETVIYNTLQYIIHNFTIANNNNNMTSNNNQQSPSTSSSSEPNVIIERPPSVCYIACNNEIRTTTSSSSSTTTTTTATRKNQKVISQGTHSWKKCRAFTSSRHRYIQNYHGLVHPYTQGSTGFKYPTECKRAYQNVVINNISTTCSKNK